MPNEELETRYWPDKFLWTEGLILLDRTKYMLDRLATLSPTIQAQFWEGKIPADFLKVLPASLARISSARILEYCGAWRSRKSAYSLLIIKARNERLSPKGTMTIAGNRIDEKKWALDLAARSKAVDLWPLPKFFERIANQNDVRFFIRLGQVLRSKKRPEEVNWNERTTFWQRFLVCNWCEAVDFRHGMPVFCQFTDEALADFCAMAVGQHSGNPSLETVRKTRQRLGLKQVGSPRVRSVKLKGNELLFG